MFVCVWCVIPANVQQGELEAGSRRSVKRQLSFQRYCHASRLLRGQVPRAPGSLHLLDHNYLGQAEVNTHSDAQTYIQMHTNIQMYIYTYLPTCKQTHTHTHSFVLFLLQHMLSKVGTWNFDIFLFERLTNGENNTQPTVIHPRYGWTAQSAEVLLCLYCSGPSSPIE